MNSSDTSIAKWIDSSAAWIFDQGSHGDWSRRAILDPALEQILPDLDGKSVLDVGCGEGRYARVMADRGARVVGIDPVPRFIERARELDARSTYLQSHAEQIPLEDQTFDLVLSYLSIIDIPDLEAASREILRVLKPKGQLIIVNISNFASPTEGWVKGAGGKKLYRIVDRYMEHFAIDLSWRGINIRNYHRPLSYIFGLFLNAGMVLDQFLEPLPACDDSNYPEEYRAPNFQIYSFRSVEKAGG